MLGIEDGSILGTSDGWFDELSEEYSLNFDEDNATRWNIRKT